MGKKNDRDAVQLIRDTVVPSPKDQRGHSSGTYAKTTIIPWTEEDDNALRVEVEERYRQRTPPPIDGPRDEYVRVTPSEMEKWSVEALGKGLPKTEEWVESFAAFYKKVVRRNRVHMRYLEFALCGAKGKAPTIKSDVESEVTCEVCKEIFSRAEDEDLG